MFADLHLHSRFSDGTYTPEEVAERGSRMGFNALSLTDHDTIEGCELMRLACEARGIEYCSGMELTAERDHNEVHLLGYFIDVKNKTLVEELKKYQTVRQSRIYEMVDKINDLGIPLRVEEVFALANCRSPGRPHVGRALVNDGFCTSLDEAFERFLKKNRPAWVPKFKISAFEAIDLIHLSGGIAVLAHPGLNHTDDFIPVMVENGLDGIECFHSKHTPSMTERYLQMAKEYKLLITGGSDCHGKSKNKPLMGTIKLPFAYWHNLKSAWEHKTGKPTIQTPPQGVQN